MKKNIKNIFEKFKIKFYKIIAVEFIQEGKLFARYLGEVYHIDDHAGECQKDMKCVIEKIKKIKVGKNTVKIYYKNNKIKFKKVKLLTITRRLL